MRTHTSWITVVAAIMLAAPSTLDAQPPHAVGTAFTYQGRLLDDGLPASGSYDFQFTLHDDPSAAGVVAGPISLEDWPVTNGLFTATLDFGEGVFRGDARWLEIGVRPGDSAGSHTILSPRQAVLPAPYALALPGLWTQQNGMSHNIIGGYGGNNVAAGVLGATVGGGGHEDSPNSITADVATIGGGRGNTVSGVLATVAGGGDHVAGGSAATIAGGSGNTANGLCSAVGGGSGNEASNWYATIGGGINNVASGGRSTVAGGENNIANDTYATVPGGLDNLAAGRCSLAAGCRAKAVYAGSFVWADSVNADFSSTAADQFLVRASGGVGIGTNSPSRTLHVAGDARIESDLLVEGTAEIASFKMTTGASDGLVLTADASGAGTWQLPSLGGPAGGDLSGTYPEPSIASGAVTSAKIADGEIASVDLASDAASLNKVSGGSMESVDGDIGIGMSSPSERLHVGGSIRAEGRILSGDSFVINGIDASIETTDTLEVHVAGERAFLIDAAASNPNLVGGASGNGASAGVTGGTISGGGRLTTWQSYNAVCDNFGTVGGGRSNRAGVDDDDLDESAYATVAGGAFNAASGYASTIGGGDNNTAAGISSVVSGGEVNTASAGEATVSGGLGNSADGYGAVVGGGESNIASDDHATVGGGLNNQAGSGDTPTVDGIFATVAGGRSNYATGDYSTIGGGYDNMASDSYSVVGGGRENVADGFCATVVGGEDSRAFGEWSLAAGRRAIASDDGAFVWADSQNAIVESTNDNQFIVRASGGVWFGVSSSPSLPSGRFINTSTGGYLSSGGAWVDSSDRDLKCDFKRVSPRAILAAVLDLPISEWSYMADDPTVRHVGPTAQDFHAAFALGEDDRHIAPLDTAGVALASIQGLCELLEEKDIRLDSQKRQIAELTARVERIEAMLSEQADTVKGGDR